MNSLVSDRALWVLSAYLHAGAAFKLSLLSDSP